MENVSKALIIAGAILLSILIIALGMRIYNSSTSSAANADLSATEIASFNSTFEAYEGDQKGTAVKSLVTAVLNSNNKNPADRHIAINPTQTMGTYDLLTDNYDYSKIVDNKTYTVKFKYGTQTGLIIAVLVSPAIN